MAMTIQDIATLKPRPFDPKTPLTARLGLGLEGRCGVSFRAACFGKGLQNRCLNRALATFGFARSTSNPKPLFTGIVFVPRVVGI